MTSGGIPTLVELLAATPPDESQYALYAAAGNVTWGELSTTFHAECRRLSALRGQRVGLAFAATCAGLARMAALQQLQADIFLFDALLPAEIQSQWAERFNLCGLLTSQDLDAVPLDLDPERVPNQDGNRPNSTPAGSVTLLTSGTTGLPKAVRHSWSGLTRPVRRQADDSRPRWLLAFRPHLYAGLQVVFQALLNRGCLVVLSPGDRADDVAELLQGSSVQFASATPSFWRQLLLTMPTQDLARVPFQQITLGGEVIDQPILDRLQAVFPTARIVHIYATTELGRCFAVSDGRAGFPASLLQTGTSDGVQLKIVAGELLVRSANSMAGYVEAPTHRSPDASHPPDATAQAMKETVPTAESDASWFATGDLVEVDGDRVRFAGRRSDLINVGGNKVSPVAVEQVIRQVPEVEEVRVYPQTSSIAGQLVACQIVIRPHADPEEVKQRVRRACLENLDRYQCPRLIEVVPYLELSDAGKLVRRQP